MRARAGPRAVRTSRSLRPRRKLFDGALIVKKIFDPAVSNIDSDRLISNNKPIYRYSAVRSPLPKLEVISNGRGLTSQVRRRRRRARARRLIQLILIERDVGERGRRACRGRRRARARLSEA
ncbi:hypothetical protein EVAR_87368_1 [Eumeta japonica]|uniref:Uncharacterized protein n=1 Tax=Eumeta variegata TaxID=151549 RepID=A0A4C1Y3G5_EUMVA|nr:hypothetical protein EVAR_87368_1 [Eumeta japonica]